MPFISRASSSSYILTKPCLFTQHHRMAAQERDIIELLDFYWFERQIFTRKPASVLQETNPVVEIHEPKVSRLSSIHVRSLSDQFLNSKASFSSDFDSFSPNSTLPTLKLETILSGKQVIEFSSESGKQQGNETETEAETVIVAKPTKPEVAERKKRRRRRRQESKSLSDLEFQELKGFMDLGFVFSEEDKDSSLVSIIPGLQRLKKDEEYSINKQMVSRPYLSEAWEVLDQRKVENPLINWRVPALENEVSMKDHLRFWAHTVASTVR